MEKAMDSDLGVHTRPHRLEHEFATLPLEQQVDSLTEAIKEGKDFRNTSGWRATSPGRKIQILQFLNRQATTVGGDGAPDGLARRQEEGTVPASGVAGAAMTLRMGSIGSNIKRKMSLINEATTMVVSGGAQAKALEQSLELSPSEKDESIKPEPVRRAKKRVRRKDDQRSKMDRPWPPCPCGDAHTPPDKKAKDFVWETIQMMKSFGDFEFPCPKTATTILATVRKFMKQLIANVKNLSRTGSCELQLIREILPEETQVYERWREMKDWTDENEASISDEEEILADELDNLGQDTTLMTRFQGRELAPRFQERLRFSDERTTAMDTDDYIQYSRYREISFASNSERFLTWIGLKSVSKKVRELLTFIAYDRLVEEAIKLSKTNKLGSMDRPLMVEEVNLAVNSLMEKGEQTL